MQITIKETAKRLMENDNITILCHRSPDGDTMGSAYALYFILSSMGKTARVCCADPFVSDFVELLPVPNFGEIDEQYVVAVDVAVAELLGDYQAIYGDKVDLCIDHHISNSFYAKETLLDANASAAGVLIAELVPELGITLTKDIATCIYLACVTDTGCFRFSNTDARTLRLVATLLEAGVENGEINTAIFESKPKSRLLAENAATAAIKYYYDDHCAIMTITNALREEHNLQDADLEGIASLPRQIKGVWVGVTIREKGELCRVSLRTTKEVNATEICEQFGGGGHSRAAGCSINATPQETEKLLLTAIEKAINEVAKT